MVRRISGIMMNASAMPRRQRGKPFQRWMIDLPGGMNERVRHDAPHDGRHAVEDVRRRDGHGVATRLRVFAQVQRAEHAHGHAE